MYRSRARHNLSPVVPRIADEDLQTLWKLFVAIGDHWEMREDARTYRLRHEAFLGNRIAMNPLYQGYYHKGCEALRSLIEQHGEEEAYRLLLGEQSGQPPPPLDSGSLEILRKRLVEEFIAVRLALGGFREFGGINYRGYFGGALLPGAPAPYRTGEAARES